MISTSKYIVYIVRTSADTLYIGQTNDLDRRFREHQAKKGRGAKYLRSFASFTLVYQETFLTRSMAMRRERELKSLPKSEKEQLIKK